MKTKITLWGIIALVAVIGFSMSACDDGSKDDNGGSGTFTLTGIPATYNGKYAVLYAENENERIQVIGAQNLNMTTGVATLPSISNGSVTLPLWTPTSSGAGITRYSGNHTLEVGVIISNKQTFTEDLDVYDVGVLFESVAFSSGSAARAWGAGTVETP